MEMSLLLSTPISLSKHGSKRRGRLLKRGMDIFGSLFALIVFFPAFLVIALLVKLTSKGPVLFAQKRVGQFGQEFTFSNFVPCMPITTRRYTENM
jgi:lipopolysaccharide/colanic/teichoic acid biosynthesis glycosyltransferase